MISVDTDVWLAFTRNEQRVERLVDLLEKGIAEVHPLVLLELDLGVSVAQREGLLRDLEFLQGPPVQSHDEVVAFAKEFGVRGAGVGYVDAHILASAYKEKRLLWSMDVEVQRLAKRLGIAFRPGRAR